MEYTDLYLGVMDDGGEGEVSIVKTLHKPSLMFNSRPKTLTKHTQELERQSIHPRTLIHPAIELVLTEKNLYVSHTRLFTLFLSFYISCVSNRKATEKERKKI